MKKFIVFIAIIFGGFMLQAQNVIQMDTVLNADGKSKVEIYNAIKSGLSEIFTNPAFVTKYDNAEEGKIIVKGTQDDISYDFTFLVKNDKYRIISKPMYCDTQLYKGIIRNDLTGDDLNVRGYSKKKKSQYIKVLKYLPLRLNATILSTMVKSVNDIQQISDW